MFDTGLTKDQILANVQTKLFQLRAALNDCNSEAAWAAGVSSADLVALGFTSADANTLLSAIADAHAVYMLYTTGLPPGSYPQPPSAYVYASSQSEVIGP
jgi:hypothetical protein